MNFDYSILSPEQSRVLSELKKYAGGEIDLWLSTPNKSFNNRPPIEILLSNNLDFFYQFLKLDNLSSVNININ